MKSGDLKIDDCSDPKSSNLQIFKSSNLQIFKSSNLQILLALPALPALGRPSTRRWLHVAGLLRLLRLRRLPLLRRLRRLPLL